MAVGSIGDEVENSVTERKSSRSDSVRADSVRGDSYRSDGSDSDAPRSREGRPGMSYDDRSRAGAMEVVVSHNIEKAMKILKRKLIKEGLFKELKSRRYYEKPSERRKRKEKESRKKARKDEARLKKGPGLL